VAWEDNLNERKEANQSKERQGNAQRDPRGGGGATLNPDGETDE
jgi:hypothetical protein